MLENWFSFVRPLGVDIWLQDATYQQRGRCLKGFSACVRLGRYVQGGGVEIDRVSGDLSAVGTKVPLAYEGNPTKSQGKKTLVPRLAQMMEVWRKYDPLTKKKIPVGIDVPEVLVELGMERDATEIVKAVGDCAVIVFYYLLQVGEYKVKNK